MVPLESSLTLPDVTIHDVTGAAAAAESVTFSVVGASDAPVIPSTPMIARTSMLGVYRYPELVIDATAGFVIGLWYSVVVTARLGGVTANQVKLHFRVGPPETVPGMTPVDTALVAGEAPENAHELTVAMFQHDTGKTYADAHARSVVKQIADNASV